MSGGSADMTAGQGAGQPLPPAALAERHDSVVVAEPLPAPSATVAVPGAGWAVKGLFVLAAVYAIYVAKFFLLPLLLALLLVFALRPVVRVLTNYAKVREPLAAALVLGVLISLIATAAITLKQPATEWIDRAPVTVKVLESKLAKVKRSIEGFRRASQKFDELAQLGPAPAPKGTVALQPASLMSRVMAEAQTLIVMVVSVVVLSFFLLASGDLFLKKTVKVIPGLREKIKAVEVARAVEHEVGRYLVTLTAINVGLGLSVVALTALTGMPNPVLWGVLVTLLNYIPYVGPFMSLGVLSLVALLTFDTLAQAMVVPISFAVITLLEGQFLQPLVIGRHFALNPVLVVVSLLFWGWLWGVPGMLVAVPVLVIMKVLCLHIERLGHIGEFLSSD